MNKYGYENFLLRLENVPSLPSVGARGLELYTWSLLVWVGVCVPVEKRERNWETERTQRKSRLQISLPSKTFNTNEYITLY